MEQAKKEGWGYSAEAILEVLLDIRDYLADTSGEPREGCEFCLSPEVSKCWRGPYGTQCQHECHQPTTSNRPITFKPVKGTRYDQHKDVGEWGDEERLKNGYSGTLPKDVGEWEENLRMAFYECLEMPGKRLAFEQHLLPQFRTELERVREEGRNEAVDYIEKNCDPQMGIASHVLEAARSRNMTDVMKAVDKQVGKAVRRLGER